MCSINQDYGCVLLLLTSASVLVITSVMECPVLAMCVDYQDQELHQRLHLLQHDTQKHPITFRQTILCHILVDNRIPSTTPDDHVNQVSVGFPSYSSSMVSRIIVLSCYHVQITAMELSIRQSTSNIPRHVTTLFCWRRLLIVK